MERRRFLQCAGCAGVLGMTGCAMMGSKGKKAMAESAIDRSDWDVSFCGLNCARCKLFEQKKCDGCRGNPDKNWSPGCKFRPCAIEKGHEYCFECEDFPCKHIDEFANDKYEHHRLAVENLKKMKAIGIEKWIAKQPKPMFCPGWKF